jgi:hypothetical protein
MRNILLQATEEVINKRVQRRNLLLCLIFTLCGDFVGNQCNYSALASWRYRGNGKCAYSDAPKKKR